MEIYNSMQYVLENDPEPLCMNFSVSKEVLGEVCVCVCVCIHVCVHVCVWVCVFMCMWCVCVHV